MKNDHMEHEDSRKKVDMWTVLKKGMTDHNEWVFKRKIDNSKQYYQVRQSHTNRNS